MAFGKKPVSSSKPSAQKTTAAAPVVASTAVRNSAVPPRTAAPASTSRKPVTREQVALRAYEIWRSGKGGSETDNWLRAERELRGA